MNTHILQTQHWANFKNSYGIQAIKANKIFYTKHLIPILNKYYAYCPRVNPFEIDFDILKKSLIKNKCIACHFDVPNIIKGSSNEDLAVDILKKHCVYSFRDEFAKGNFILDTTKNLNEIVNNMHPKQRYNIKLAQKNGLNIKKHSNKDLDIFYELYKDTAIRQGYFFRSKVYFEKLLQELKDKVIILIIEHQNIPLASWMLFLHENVLYYPYGGSSKLFKNLQPNALMGYEAIKLAKEKNCDYFDMWGAAFDLDNKKDPYYGFTDFKRKFGGTHVQYIDSYDFVINQNLYKLFIFLNTLRWKLLNIIR